MARASRSAFIAGVSAAGLALVADFAGRFLLGFLSLPEMILNLLTAVTPASVFGLALVHLRYFGRPVTLVVLAAGLLVGGGVTGIVVARARTRMPGRLAEVCTAVILAAGADVALVGPSGQTPYLAAAVWYPLQAAFFTVALAFVMQIDERQGQEVQVGRRLFLEYIGLGAASAVIGTAVVKGLRDLGADYLASTPTGSIGPFGVMPTPITPTTSFYVVSKNLLGDPQPDAASWALEVRGDSIRFIGLDELRRRMDAEQYQTLECISNDVGGDLISTARWRGVRLKTVLTLTGPLSSYRYVLFEGADGYSESLPLDVAMDEATMIALEMNGAALPSRHGFPARLLIPGRYGMKNIKWLTSIQLSSGDADGYWEQRGWSKTAIVKTMSRFDVPNATQAKLGHPVRLGGIAYAGRRRISAVEVGVDGQWQRAQLQRALGSFTWVLWTMDWTPHRTGSHTLEVRAIDGGGVIQSMTPAPPIPTGASGRHRIVIDVH